MWRSVVWTVEGRTVTKTCLVVAAPACRLPGRTARALKSHYTARSSPSPIRTSGRTNGCYGYSRQQMLVEMDRRWGYNSPGDMKVLVRGMAWDGGVGFPRIAHGRSVCRVDVIMVRCRGRRRRRMKTSGRSRDL